MASQDARQGPADRTAQYAQGNQTGSSQTSRPMMQILRRSEDSTRSIPDSVRGMEGKIRMITIPPQ